MLRQTREDEAVRQARRGSGAACAERTNGQDSEDEVWLRGDPPIPSYLQRVIAAHEGAEADAHPG